MLRRAAAGAASAGAPWTGAWVVLRTPWSTCRVRIQEASGPFIRRGGHLGLILTIFLLNDCVVFARPRPLSIIHWRWHRLDVLNGLALVCVCTRALKLPALCPHDIARLRTVAPRGSTSYLRWTMVVRNCTRVVGICSTSCPWEAGFRGRVV